MEELKSRLTKELLQGFNVKIMDSSSWDLPVHSIEIEYETVKRTKMDILMKMILLAVQKVEIETAEELSEILLVEQLFIQDVIDKMTRTRMIDKRSDYFELTDAGSKQLKSGVYEHEPENGLETLIFSPCHEAFLSEEITDITDDEQEDYRYYNNFSDWEIASVGETTLMNALKNKYVESDEGNTQVVLSKIIAAIDRQIELVPCIEFRLHNAEEDLMYARVWNTLTNQWDATLEAQLNENERKAWRKKYLSDEKASTRA